MTGVLNEIWTSFSLLHNEAWNGTLTNLKFNIFYISIYSTFKCSELNDQHEFYYQMSHLDDFNTFKIHSSEEVANVLLSAGWKSR